MDWLKILPGLHLLQCIRFGLRVRVIVPALLMLITSWAGLLMISETVGLPYEGKGGSEDSVSIEPMAGFPWHALPDTEDRIDRGISFADFRRMPLRVVPPPVHALVHSVTSLVAGSPSIRRDFLEATFTALMCLLFGTAIGRSVATGFCTGTRTGAVPALRFSMQQIRSSLLSTTLAGLLISLPLCAIGGVSWLAGFELPAWLIRVGWPLVALLGLAAVLGTFVVVAGWLLSLAAIGTDRCYGADALSRGINYVLSHPARTAAWLCVVLLAAAVTEFLAQGVLDAVTSVLDARLESMSASAILVDKVDGTDRSVLWWWHAGIGCIPAAVRLGVFFSGTTIMYILLRQKEDAVRLRELDGGR